MSCAGPVITFTLRWADGTPIGFSEVGRLAAERNIHLRTGTLFLNLHSLCHRCCSHFHTIFPLFGQAVSAM